MSLKKFVSIQNVGRFHNSKAAGDVEFRKFTLIYGENGRGKTTICAILRSLQSGDPNHIIGRQTLGSANAADVCLLVDGQTPTTKFQSGAWSQTLPTLAIFDQHFVSENVYLGDGVGAEQKRNLYKVIVGQNAVAKAQRMDQLVADIRKTSAAIREASRAVESHLVPGLKLQALMDAQPDPEIDQRIAKLEAEILNASATTIIAKSVPFGLVELPPRPTGIEECLSETIASVSSSVEQQLKAHLVRHHMGSAGQGWIAQGLEFTPDEGCPFCGQDLAGIGLVDAYKVIFSDAYAGLKERITKLGKGVADAFPALKMGVVLEPLAERQKGIDLWKPMAEFAAPAGPSEEDAQRIVANYRDQLLRILRVKHQAPLESLALDQAAREAERDYDQLVAAIDAYNVSAKVANAAIQARQAQLKLVNPDAAKAEIERLKTLKKRHEPQLKALCDRLAELNTQKTQQETERDTIKGDLDQHSGDVVARYQNAINRYLDLFNAGFSIAKVDHNYVGGVNASYQLLINKVPVALGDERTPLDKPSFKNTLSAGDKSTLALALFLSQLDNDPGRNQRVVVFDDPFNSQDSFRRNQTAIEIVRAIPNVAQVVVLSHDARFLKEMVDKAHSLETKTLKLNPVGETTEICALDLDEMLRTEVRVLVDILQTYFAGSGGQPRDVVQKIRPLLEAYSRNSCITLFQPDDILSTILTKIRTTGASHPLWPVYNELNDINDFTCRHHHADGTVTGPIDETELRGYVKRTLRVVGALGA